MLDVKTYIKLVMKKKNLTYDEFCRRINVVKRELGDSGSFRKPNLAEIFNTDRGVEERTLMIFEAALELPMGSLTSMSQGALYIQTKRNNKKDREVLKNAKFNF